MTDTDILTLAETIVSGFEGFRSAPYQDSKGVWTIGYGTTVIRGEPVTPATPPVTKAQAKAFQQLDLAKALKDVQALVKVPLGLNQSAALVSFVYNVGAGALRTSTLLRKLNASDYVGAANQLPLWDMSGGRVLKGLSTRRAAERALFLKPDPDEDAPEAHQEAPQRAAVSPLATLGASLVRAFWDAPTAS